jgi:hypothetical protein
LDFEICVISVFKFPERAIRAAVTDAKQRRAFDRRCLSLGDGSRLFKKRSFRRDGEELPGTIATRQLVLILVRFYGLRPWLSR